MNKVKYSLIYFTALIYGCGTNGETNMTSSSLEFAENEYKLDLSNLSSINFLNGRNVNDCHIAVLDSSSGTPLLKLNLGYRRNLKMNVVSFGDRLIAIDYLGTKDSYVREERVFVFGDSRGVLKYDFIVNGDKVRFTGLSIFKESVEKNYAFIDPNPFLDRPNYLDSILSCSTSLLIEQDFDYSEFKYSISNGQLVMNNNSLRHSNSSFTFNLDSLQNCIDLDMNIKIAVFCLR